MLFDLIVQYSGLVNMMIRNTRFVYSGFTVLTTCFVVLIVLNSLQGWEKVKFGDAQDYIDAGIAFGSTGQFPRQTSLPFFRPPLYPLMIAAVWSLFPSKIIIALKVAQIIIHLLTVGIILRIAKEFKLTNMQSFFAGMFYGLDPFVLRCATDIQTEPLHALLISAALLGFFKIIACTGSTKVQNAYLSFSACMLGLASLCRPSALFVGLVCGAFLSFLLYHRRKDFLKFLKMNLFYYVAFFATILPWTLYNRYNLGEWILVTDGGGYHLWLGNHPDNLKIHEGSFQDQNAFSEYAFGKLQKANVDQKITDWEVKYSYGALSLKERENLWKNEFMTNLKAMPIQDLLRLSMYKALTFWRPWLNSNAYSPKVVTASLLINCTKFLFCIIGIWNLLNDSSKVSRQFAILIIFFFIAITVPHIITHSMMRFRLPYAEPIIDLMAGGIVASFLNVKFSFRSADFVTQSQTPSNI